MIPLALTRSNKENLEAGPADLVPTVPNLVPQWGLESNGGGLRS